MNKPWHELSRVHQYRLRLNGDIRVPEDSSTVKQIGVRISGTNTKQFKPNFTRSVKVKKTIALLDKNNKEGMKLVNEFTKHVMSYDPDDDCDSNYIEYISELGDIQERMALNKAEQKKLMAHLKELAK